MFRLLAVVALLALLPAALLAQDEATLRRYFEGRTVVVRVDMPGTSRGIDVWPGREQSFDAPEYAERLKRHGTAIPMGRPAMITRVKLKGKHIEFQLGGGGFGTAGDPSSTSVSFTPAEKTLREKNLERALERETDRRRRAEMREELDFLRTEREREDQRLRVIAAEAEEHRRANVHRLATQGGSRFNVRFDDAVPAEALTPGGLERMLERWVDFAGPAPVPDAADGPAALRKGMSEASVDQLLGSPVARTAHTEGSLAVTVRRYERDDASVEAMFVEGVLVRYTVGSR
jgi:hypothetical protein